MDLSCLLFCHAGHGVGLGHLTRSLVIAKDIEHSFDADIRFLIQGEPLFRDDLSRFTHHFIDPETDVATKILDFTGLNLVILDLNPKRIPENLDQILDDLHRNGVKVISIDGLLQYQHQLDLIFMPSLTVKSYGAFSGDTPIVSGWDCFLLDDELLPINWTSGKKVLVLTGGSDASDLGQSLPSLIDRELPLGTEIDWITGPFSARPTMPSSSRLRFTEHIAPSGLSGFMGNSNYALTVLGVSFFELLRVGVPSIVFSPYGEKDEKVLDSINKSGVAIVAANERDAVSALRRLMSEHQTAARLSETGKKRLLKSGAIRLRAEIRRLFRNGGRAPVVSPVK
jgi:spore coat polysaccharide biosynthesis predicted glycosyltransferase SpsG